MLQSVSMHIMANRYIQKEDHTVYENKRSDVRKTTYFVEHATEKSVRVI